MTERINEVLGALTNTEIVIRGMKDSLEDAAKLFRKIGNNEGTSLVAEWERRNLVRKDGVTIAFSKADRVVSYLSRAQPPLVEFGNAEWERFISARMALVEIVTANEDKVELAVDKPALNGWFVGKLINAAPEGLRNATEAARLVALSFKAART